MGRQKKRRPHKEYSGLGKWLVLKRDKYRIMWTDIAEYTGLTIWMVYNFRSTVNPDLNTLLYICEYIAHVEQQPVSIVIQDALSHHQDYINAIHRNRKILDTLNIDRRQIQSMGDKL